MEIKACIDWNLLSSSVLSHVIIFKKFHFIFLIHHSTTIAWVTTYIFSWSSLLLQIHHFQQAWQLCWKHKRQKHIRLISAHVDWMKWINTVFVRIDAHVQIVVHPSFLTEWMLSNLGIFHVLFAFCGTLVMQNVEITEEVPSSACITMATCLYCIDR